MTNNDQNPRHETYIYFVFNGYAIKIGKTACISCRMAELQTSNPVPLELLGVMLGNGNLESRLHRRFAKYRLAGEWFKDSLTIRSFIEEQAMHTEESYRVAGEYLARILKSLPPDRGLRKWKYHWGKYLKYIQQDPARLARFRYWQITNLPFWGDLVNDLWHMPGDLFLDMLPETGREKFLSLSPQEQVKTIWGLEKLRLESRLKDKDNHGQMVLWND